nr:AAA family ATPase [Cronobacter muytjensii]
MLGERLNYPVTHLDRLFWGPGWLKPDAEEFREKVTESVLAAVWISEGNYARRTFDLRLSRADLVIWLNTPRITCLFRVLIRSLLNKPRSDLPDGCSEKINYEFLEFLRYVWCFDTRDRPEIERLRIKLGSDVPVIYLHNRKQIKNFLSDIHKK